MKRKVIDLSCQEFKVTLFNEPSNRIHFYRIIDHP